MDSTKMENSQWLAGIRHFFGRPFFSDPRTLLGLWLILGVVSALTKIHKCNNFLIFKYVFWHAWEQTSLYAQYPSEFFDSNHYGPFFSIIIAPFAVLPHPLGLLFWHVLMTLALFVAIRKLPLRQGKQIFCYWFCAHELLTALFMSQFNIIIAAIIIASFYCVEKEYYGRLLHHDRNLRETLWHCGAGILFLFQAQGEVCGCTDRMGSPVLCPAYGDNQP